MIEEIIALIFAFIIGAVIGSFLNVLIYRLPRGLSPIKPVFSFCPSCGKKIKWYDNIPIISYFLLKGRCRYCKEPISIKYPLVETLSGFASVLTYLKVGFSIDYIFLMFFFGAMITLSFIDFEFQIIPDEINFTGFFVGIIYSFFRSDNFTPLDAIIGAIVGAGFLLIIKFIYEKFKGIEALGWGDVKLLLFIGSFTGWFGALFTIFAGSLLATLISLLDLYLSKRDEDFKTYELAFGPYLAIAGSIYVLVGDVIDKYFLLS
jgi:leader peptidase (prepilin peptidase)/N-methyltransferase